MRTYDLLLTAAIQQKNGVDQILPLLEYNAKTDPNLSEITECYKRIQIDLNKSRLILPITCFSLSLLKSIVPCSVHCDLKQSNY